MICSSTAWFFVRVHSVNSVTEFTWSVLSFNLWIRFCSCEASIKSLSYFEVEKKKSFKFAYNKH